MIVNIDDRLYLEVRVVLRRCWLDCDYQRVSMWRPPVLTMAPEVRQTASIQTSVNTQLWASVAAAAAAASTTLSDQLETTPRNGVTRAERTRPDRRSLVIAPADCINRRRRVAAVISCCVKNKKSQRQKVHWDRLALASWYQLPSVISRNPNIGRDVSFDETNFLVSAFRAAALDD